MLVFYDPAKTNQVMAIYTGNTTSDAWESQGYQRIQVSKPTLVKQIGAMARDCKVTISKGQVTKVTASVNPVQPQPDPADVARAESLASAKAKLAALGLTEGEIQAITR